MSKSLVSNSLYNVLYKIVTALYPLIAVTYVSHILGANKMGVVSYAQNIVSYFAVFAALGIPIYGIKEIAVRTGNNEEQSQLFWELFLINSISTSLALILYLSLIVSADRFSGNIALYLVAGLQIAFNYLNFDWFYQGVEDYKYISIRSIVIKIVTLVLLPILVKTQADYINYALIYCLAIGGNNIFNTMRLRRYINRPRRGLSIKKHLKPISSLLLVSVAVEIYSMIDTTMLGVYCTDEVVGCYSNAMKLTRLVNTTAAAMGAVLFPRLSVIFSQNNKEQFNNLVNRGISIMLMIAFPSTVGLILCSKYIVLALFGESFYGAIDILKILALMIPVVVCNTIMGGQVLVTTNTVNRYVQTVMIASVTNVVLNALMIPRFGAVSAAVASLISELLDLVLYCWFARKYVKVHLKLRYFMSIFIPLVLYSVLSVGVIENLPLNIVTKLILNIVICGVLYFGLGYTLKNEAICFTYQKIKNLVHFPDDSPKR